jgi:AraC-like DNA-binding protein
VRRYSENITYRPDLSTCNSPISLRSVAREKLPLKHGKSKRCMDFIQLLWTNTGSGLIQVGEQDYDLKPNDAVICLPGIPRSLMSNSVQWDYSWITFDGACAETILSELKLPLKPFPEGEFCRKYSTEFEILLKQPSPLMERLASGKLYDFLIHLSCKLSYKDKESSGALLDEAIIEIESEFANSELNVNYLAEKLNVSRFSIHRLFFESLGVAPKAYIDSIRLQKVMQQLVINDSTLEAIASQTGFASGNYLAKFFIKKMGYTPSQFRKSEHSKVQPGSSDANLH